ncbi:hypothetical protein BD324DRAFT_636639 [Kockovaella imperatae]|uniref:tRNA-intron lyase n=1 Tax=Kockovaella imperatae TaxID=4999 RepID=A0A1Y1U9C0_9TREE|nr:hypothetical protein BD324DRAFT_636639 [Kockovaella imperatae]ORX34107.1 hypothetical protein BD324DRAFT_636639 [Kockovaella imperatae]
MSGPTQTSSEGPSGPSYRGGSSSKPSNRSRFQANNKKYGTPLPILLPSSPLHPAYQAPSRDTVGSRSSFISTFLSVFEAPVKVEVPQCVGVFDPLTRSVWITDPKDMAILFNRGFFGKGTFSRSEPTWKSRRLDQVRGGQSAAAEKLREKRRLERKQFKIDRAEAMLSAAKAAEQVLVTGQMPSEHGPDEVAEGSNGDAGNGEEGNLSGRAASPALTTGTDVDLSTLTPQTFLVRPTRPDANRNRGKNAFKRRPKPVTSVNGTTVEAGPSNAMPSSSLPRSGVSDQEAPSVQPAVVVVPDDYEQDLSEDDFEESIVEDLEHLQLGLEEAWFLSSGIGVLKIYDTKTQSFIPRESVLALLQTSPVSRVPKTPTAPPRLFPDDPFLISYACYHHFRSLGWVVKPGIKFSADWLLYRKGPVFSHAAFSLVIVPVYASSEDRRKSPYAGQDWFQERMSWKWISTVMRVNSLVQKNVIMIYVTVPSVASFDASLKFGDGSLDPKKVDMKALLRHYAIQEVSLSRFSPARRR